MSRLIQSDDSGNWSLKGLPWRNIYVGKTVTEETQQKLYGALCKLKDYEDTGEEPWQIEECNELFDKIFLRKCREVNRLRKEVAEQGKLLKLPCALGDTVYATFGGKVSEQIVRGILFRENKIWAQDGNGSIFGEFGEDVFFTWEEAEAALKEL